MRAGVAPFREEGLRQVLNAFVAHYREQGNHQGEDGISTEERTQLCAFADFRRILFRDHTGYGRLDCNSLSAQDTKSPTTEIRGERDEAAAIDDDEGQPPPTVRCGGKRPVGSTDDHGSNRGILRRRKTQAMKHERATSIASTGALSSPSRRATRGWKRGRSFTTTSRLGAPTSSPGRSTSRHSSRRSGFAGPERRSQDRAGVPCQWAGPQSEEAGAGWGDRLWAAGAAT
jgi:hypothetical protein